MARNLKKKKVDLMVVVARCNARNETTAIGDGTETRSYISKRKRIPTFIEKPYP